MRQWVVDEAHAHVGESCASPAPSSATLLSGATVCACTVRSCEVVLQGRRGRRSPGATRTTAPRRTPTALMDDCPCQQNGSFCPEAVRPVEARGPTLDEVGSDLAGADQPGQNRPGQTLRTELRMSLAICASRSSARPRAFATPLVGPPGPSRAVRPRVPATVLPSIPRVVRILLNTSPPAVPSRVVRPGDPRPPISAAMIPLP